MKIINKEYYRSKPIVNMTDDLVRITITAKQHELRKLEQFVEERPNQAISTDTKPRCDKCKNWNDKSILANFCYNCGRALSR